jgi:C-terminal processing protease CtpA/Prc
MKSSLQLRVAAAMSLLIAALTSAPVVAQPAVTVVEYYNKAIAAYFLTGRATEQAVLDGISDFQRTGVSFVATAAEGATAPLDSVCRYRIAIPNSNLGVPGQPFSSHFYGLTADCGTIAGYNFPNFYNEGFDFAVERPNNGVCPASSPVRVYRALRNLTPVDVPNHRYSVSTTAYDEMLTRGWTGEGVVFCAKSAVPETPRTVFASSLLFEDRCAVPRVGSSPYTGRAYPDRQGTLADEKSWLRSWKDENYLWYREIPSLNSANYPTATSYYDALKTSVKVVSGVVKDRFSWWQSTAEYEQSAVSGASFGYGIRWSFVRNTPPRTLIAALVTPGSPAALAGVTRGDKVLSIDGVDLIYGNDVNTLNRGLSPQSNGESHRFVLQPADGSALRDVTLVAGTIITEPVPVQGVIDTPTGKVGYVALTTFSTNSTEAALVNTFAGLSNARVNDLVLDLRYNGGGLVAISSQLAYMIAGPARTAGKVFSRDKFNDKLPYGIFGTRPSDVQTPFYTTTQGRSVAAGQPLPTLNLGRVFVLTSASSCSASESLINGLRGINVEVVTVGSTTCGKPYAFYPWDNCGTTYYSIQISAANDKGEGDYIDGFPATCAASDDLTRVLGDVSEGQLAAALSRRANGSCAAVATEATAKRRTGMDDADPQAVRLPFNPAEELLIVERPDRPAVTPAWRTELPKIQPATPRRLGDVR